MKVKDDQVFMVSGYTGQEPVAESLFAAHVIAVDRDDAKTTVQELIGDLTVVGVMSLAELEQAVAAMRKVKAGEIEVPVSAAIAGVKD